jgi:uncharacterized membrane protein
MAYRLSLRQKYLVMSLHVLASMAWFGGTLSLLLLLLSMNDADTGAQLFHAVSRMHIIDDALIKYPGLVVLSSGLMLSTWTAWGLLKYHWVVIKLVLTVVLILIGIAFVPNWLSFIVGIAESRGSVFLLQSHDFQGMHYLILIALLNIAAMALMTFVTQYKPFGKIRR